MKPKFNIGDKVTTGKITGYIKLIRWPTITNRSPNQHAKLDENGIAVYGICGINDTFQEHFLTKINE